MKYLAYKIPFQSYQGVDYEVRIYAETSAQVAPSAVVLYGGEQPFVTEENDSDDIFEPVRHQTGTIQVVDNAGTGRLAGLMEKLCPENNVSTPVLLVEKNGASESVIWHGFLNCESYSQDYVGTPQAIELPVNSILEAMDSVQVEADDFDGVITIHDLVCVLLGKMESLSVIGFGRIYYSEECTDIWEKYINTSILFEQKEQNNEDSTLYIVSGLSCKEILSIICTFMGWTVREEGRDIYFERIGEARGMISCTWSEFNSMAWPNVLSTQHALDNVQMSGFTWMGNSHERSVNQGAKSVEVVAKVGRENVSIEIPEMPLGNTMKLDGFATHKINYRPESIQPPEFTLGDIYVDKHTIIGNIRYKQYHLNINVSPATARTYNIIALRTETDSATALEHWDDMWNNVCKEQSYGNTIAYSYSCLSKFPIGKDGDEEYKNGVLLCGLYYEPPISQQDGYIMRDDQCIFSIRTLTTHVLHKGKLKLNITEEFRANNWNYIRKGAFFVSIRVGNKYATGYFPTGWVSEQIGLPLLYRNEDGTFEVEFDINETLIGDIEIRVYDFIMNCDYYYEGLADWYAPYIFLSDLTLSYKQDEDILRSGRSENHYFRLLGGKFSEEVSVDTDIASDLNNQPSPNILLNDDRAETTVKELDYIDSQGYTKSLRPEKDLLNRMALFYGKIRRKIDLDISPISKMPIKKVIGLEEHPIHYLPLAQNRNWVQGTARLTCIEDINGDE